MPKKSKKSKKVKIPSLRKAMDKMNEADALMPYAMRPTCSQAAMCA
jgi:hypothetical protein